jgi:hypothetical protein
MLHNLDKELSCKHAICKSVFDKRQEARQTKHLREVGVYPSAHRVGDMVLVGHVDYKTDRICKLQCTWLGPYQVVHVIDDWCYSVMDLRSFPNPGPVTDVHSIYLRPFSGNRLNVTEELVEQIEYSISMFRVEKIHRFRFRNRRFEFHVKWRGVPSTQNTWTNALSIYAHAHKAFDEYVSSLKSSDRELILDFVLYGKFPLTWYGKKVSPSGDLITE